MPLEIPIYVINLDRSTARLAHASTELAREGLGFVRVPAVDAGGLSDETVAAVYDAGRNRRGYYVPLHRGEIACFLSHRRALETFLRESEAPFAVFFEDDFALTDALRPVLAAVAAGPLPPWDMIRLWSRTKSLAGEVARVAGHALVRHRVLPTLMIGQIISREGAEKILAATRRFHRPIDVEVQYWWELGLRIFSLHPPIVADASALIGGSDLQRSALPGTGRKIRREVGRVFFRATLFVKSAYHHWRRPAGS